MEQEIEVTFKVKLRYPPKEICKAQYGVEDPRECFASDWEVAEDELVELIASEDWTIINVEMYKGEGDAYEVASLAKQVLDNDS